MNGEGEGKLQKIARSNCLAVLAKTKKNVHFTDRVVKKFMASQFICYVRERR